MPSPRFKTPLLLLVIYAGVLMYGAFRPFGFTWHPGRDGTNVRREVEWQPFTHLCPTWGIFCPRDTGLNIAIFIPVGALAALLSGVGSGVIRPTARAVTCGFCLSLLIETTQYFIPSRFPSTTDLLWNALGSGLGGLLVAGIVKNYRFGGWGWKKKITNCGTTDYRNTKVEAPDSDTSPGLTPDRGGEGVRKTGLCDHATRITIG